MAGHMHCTEPLSHWPRSKDMLTWCASFARPKKGLFSVPVFGSMAPKPDWTELKASWMLSTPQVGTVPSSSSGGGEARVRAVNLRQVLDGGATDHLFGDRVQLQGLQAKPEMNGTTGVVQKLDLATGRYVVKLNGGGEAKVRAANLLPLLE